MASLAYRLYIDGVWQDSDGDAEPEDIAVAVAWLVSDEARHVTGIQLPVDLGRTNR